MSTVTEDIQKAIDQKAIEELLALSRLGDAEAQFKLAGCYYNGTGVPHDFSQVVYWFRKAAAQGHARALGNLNTFGTNFFLGNNAKITQDLKQAIELFTFAAEAGHATALNNLALVGVQVYSGTSPYPKDSVQGVELLKIAAKLGHKTALHNLGGVAVEIAGEDPERGVELLRIASELGNLKAKRNLAVAVFKGIGIKADANEGIRLLKACYEAGDNSVLEDINTFAYNFLSGNEEEIAQDFKKAVELFAFAAKAGHAKGLDNLALVGIWFYNGTSPCPQDRTQAVEIFKIAAKLGDERALENLGVAASDIAKECPKTGFELLTMASELGNLKAKRNLAICFLQGIGVKADADEAVRLLKACYEAGDESVLEDLNSVGKHFLLGEAETIPDLKKAVELFSFAAQGGDATALANLSVVGIWFYEGTSPCSKDRTQAVELFKTAAKLGDKKALHNLEAVASEITRECPKTGFELLTIATDLGSLIAKRNLAVCYLYGRGVKADTSEAIRLLKECYGVGDESVLEDLHTIATKLLVAKDTQTPQDLNKAVELFIFAAQAGHVEALINLSHLGVGFYGGLPPFPQDRGRAIEMFKIAAKLGHLIAVDHLGTIAIEVFKEEEKAGFELLALASELGNVEAKRNLAICFVQGKGVKTDTRKAIRLLKECYDAGHQTVLGDFNSIGADMLTGKKIKKNIELGIRLWAFAAHNDHQGAKDNLRTFANHLLAWQQYECDYGIEQNIAKGLRLLNYLAFLGDKESTEQLTQIRALRIPIPMPKVSETTFLRVAGLVIGPDTPDAPHSPHTKKFLEENNISISKEGDIIIISNNSFDSSVFTDVAMTFKAERNERKWNHFTGVLDALTYFKSVEPLQEIVFGYLQDEVSPLFFQYKKALKNMEQYPLFDLVPSVFSATQVMKALEKRSNPMVAGMD